jgi:hypothetical protein
MADRPIIVLAANMRIVDDFRRSRGLRQRDVIGMTPANADTAVRGLFGDFEVITHETWEPTPAVHALVERHLAIMRATAPRGEREA